MWVPPFTAPSKERQKMMKSPVGLLLLFVVASAAMETLAQKGVFIPPGCYVCPVLPSVNTTCCSAGQSCPDGSECCPCGSGQSCLCPSPLPPTPTDTVPPVCEPPQKVQTHTISQPVWVPSTNCSCETPETRGVLSELFNATGGSGWTNRVGWLSQLPVCTWYGVSCNGTALSIRLESNNLSGTVPDALSALTQIQQLSLGFNQLRGTLPTSWSNLTRLQSLFLFKNELSGTLPSSWWMMKEMQELGLDSNQLSGTLPSSWSMMTQLQLFTLQFNNLLHGTLPTSWGSLTQLVGLSLEGNRLSGTLPSSWVAMTKLGHLGLVQNHFCGAEPSSWDSVPALNCAYQHIAPLPNCSTYIP